MVRKHRGSSRLQHIYLCEKKRGARFWFVISHLSVYDYCLTLCVRCAPLKRHQMHSLTALGYTFCVKTALILYIYPRARLFENAPAVLSLSRSLARRRVVEQCAKVAILFLGPMIYVSGPAQAGGKVAV